MMSRNCKIVIDAFLHKRKQKKNLTRYWLEEWSGMWESNSGEAYWVIIFSMFFFCLPY